LRGLSYNFKLVSVAISITDKWVRICLSHLCVYYSSQLLSLQDKRYFNTWQKINFANTVEPQPSFKTSLHHTKSGLKRVVNLVMQRRGVSQLSSLRRGEILNEGVLYQGFHCTQVKIFFRLSQLVKKLVSEGINCVWNSPEIS
jgi:hypothetical protein